MSLLFLNRIYNRRCALSTSIEIRRDLEDGNEPRRKVEGLTFKAMDTLDLVMDCGSPKEARQAAETVLNRVGFVKRDEATPSEPPMTPELKEHVVLALCGLAEMVGMTPSPRSAVELRLCEICRCFAKNIIRPSELTILPL